MDTVPTEGCSQRRNPEFRKFQSYNKGLLASLLIIALGAQWTNIPSALGRDKIFILLYRNPQKDSHIQILGASQSVQVVKNALANAGDLREMGLIPGSGRSPGKGHGTHSSTIAWRVPGTEEPGGLQSIASRRVRHDRSDFTRVHAHARARTHTHTHTHTQTEAHRHLPKDTVGGAI